MGTYTYTGSFLDKLAGAVPRSLGGNTPNGPQLSYAYVKRLDNYWSHYLERRIRNVGLEP